MEVATPALIVDLPKLAANARRMIAFAKEQNVSLRPHIKTHKTIEGAFYQLFGDDERRSERLASPLCKITVSTLGEARFYAKNGFQDILYAVPLSRNKLRAAYELIKEIKHFHVIFDHPDHLIAAKEFWEDNREEGNWKWSVYLQVDSGGHRCGVPKNSKSAISFACDMINSECAELVGIYTHAGHSYAQGDTGAIRQVILDEKSTVEEFAMKIYDQLCDETKKCALVKNLVISRGSTPSLSFLPPQDDKKSSTKSLFRVNEYHPGNYIFYDEMQVELGSCSLDDCAAYVLGSVISTYPERNQFLVDCGALALSKDAGLSRKIHSLRDDDSFSWGYIEGHPTALITSITQELGVVQLPPNGESTLDSFPIGSSIKILTHHSCLTAACFPCFTIVEKGKVVATWQTCPRDW